MQLPTQKNIESMSQDEFDSFLVDIEGGIDLLSEEQLEALQSHLSKVEELSDIEKARTDFATFVKLCGNPILKFSSRGQHNRLCDAFEDLVDGDLKRLTISMSPRQGKALAVDTPIPTPIGWTNIGNLKAGDDVFSADGSICKVKNVSPVWKDRYSYYVGAVGGRSAVIADEKHEWLVNGFKYETRLLYQSVVFGYRIRLDDGPAIWIEPCSHPTDTICIEVDHPSHTFLAGLDRLPTCNSEFGSICLPAWAVGKNPTWKVIQASAGDKLATNFGRQVKAIIDSPIYKRIFPGVTLSKDSKANSRFATNKGGMYYAVGVGTNLAGWGGDLIICLPKGEPVYGIIKHDISDVADSDTNKLVLSYDGNGLPCLGRVQAKFINNTLSLVSLSTKKSKMRCTPDHPVWVKGRGYVRASEIKTGDVLMSLRSHHLALFVAMLLHPGKCFAEMLATMAIAKRKLTGRLAQLVERFTK